MRVVVFGATGNVGSALVRALEHEDRVESIVGVARRITEPGATRTGGKLSWAACDVSSDTLDVVVAGSDVVVDLAWLIQPSRDEVLMMRTNLVGTRRIADAVAFHGVPAFVYASSVGAYARHPKTRRVDETHAALGIASSTYSRHKAEVESMLDVFESLHPTVRVVRMRTSLVFQRAAASEIHRLFLGRLMPWHLPRPLRFVPNISDLQFQATHADDIADAYRRAIVGDVHGAFNIAAEPVLNPSLIANAVSGRTVPMPAALLRAAVAITYRLRIQPTEPGWLDMAMESPLMDTARARAELGWTPSRTSVDALIELIEGIGDGAGGDSEPLRAKNERPILDSGLEGRSD